MISGRFAVRTAESGSGGVSHSQPLGRLRHSRAVGPLLELDQQSAPDDSRRLAMAEANPPDGLSPDPVRMK
jgi:hypothetical protein